MTVDTLENAGHSRIVYSEENLIITSSRAGSKVMNMEEEKLRFRDVGLDCSREI